MNLLSPSRHHWHHRAFVSAALGRNPRPRATSPDATTLGSTPDTVVWGYISSRTPPVLRIKSGTTVRIDTMGVRMLSTDERPREQTGASASVASGGGAQRQRVVLGFVVALVFGPLLSWFLYRFRTPESITSEVLAYQLLVVIVALIGGIWPALFAAVLSGLTLDFLFVAPLFTVTIADPLHALALVLYVVIAILVSYIVDQAARRTRAAQRAAAESELLATVAGASCAARAPSPRS